MWLSMQCVTILCTLRFYEAIVNRDTCFHTTDHRLAESSQNYLKNRQETERTVQLIMSRTIIFLQWKCSVGVFSGSVQGECSVGVFSGSVQGGVQWECSVGVFSGSVQGECSVGVFSGSVQWEWFMLNRQGGVLRCRLLRDT